MGSKLEVAEIKVAFYAPNPKNPAGETLTKESEPTEQANFHWATYQILFTAQGEGEEEPKYYVYSEDLTVDGKRSLPNKVFESDSDWDGTNKNSPTPDFTPGDVIRDLETKKGQLLLKEPDRIKNLVQKLKDGSIDHHDVVFINMDKTDKGGVYSVEKFKENFDENFYVVLSGGKEKMNPLEKPVGVTKEAMAIRIAMEGVQTGGRDIMRRMVQKQKAERGQEAPLSGDSAFTGGFGEMRKWQEQKEGQPPKDMGPGQGEGYDVMKNVLKNPTPIKKVAKMVLKPSGKPHTYIDDKGNEVDSDDVQWHCKKCGKKYNEAHDDCECGEKSPFEIKG